MSARPHKVRPAAESLLSGQCSSCCSRAPDGHVGGALHRDLWRSDGRQLGAGACAHRCHCARRLEQPLHARRGRLGGVLLRATTRCAAGHAPLKHHHHLSKCSLRASPPLHHLLSSPRSSLTTYHSLLTSHLSLTSHFHPYHQHRAALSSMAVAIRRIPPHAGPLQRSASLRASVPPWASYRCAWKKKKFKSEEFALATTTLRTGYSTAGAHGHGTAGCAKCAQFRSSSGSIVRREERPARRARLWARAFARARTPSPAAGLVQPELARVVAIFTLHCSRAPHALFSTSKHPYRPRGR